MNQHESSSLYNERQEKSHEEPHDDTRAFAQNEDGTYTITGDMLIGDVIAAFPRAAGIMLRYGLHCVGCHANMFDTIEDGARGHGMLDEDIASMIREINEMLARRIETIDFTPQAIEKVKEFRSEEAGKETWPLRVRVLDHNNAPSGSSGYELDFDQPNNDDLHFSFDGLEVIIDPHSFTLLRGSNVEFVDTPDGGGFRIDNPNV